MPEHMTAAEEAARSERSSDAHDPKAKASWIGLLSFLSDDELARYGGVVADQRAIEARTRSLEALSVVAGLGAISLAVLAYGTGYGFWPIALLLACGVWFGYWPYRKVKVRRLWAGHIAAVERETERRRMSADAPDADEVVGQHHEQG